MDNGCWMLNASSLVETVEIVEEAHSAGDSFALPAPTSSLDYFSSEESSSDNEDFEEISGKKVTAKY